VKYIQSSVFWIKRTAPVLLTILSCGTPIPFTLAQSSYEIDSPQLRLRQLELNMRAIREGWTAVKKKSLKGTEQQLGARERARLNPPQELLNMDSAFLKQPATGLFRLMAVGDTGDSLVINTPILGKDATIVPIAGGGAYYSFTTLGHDQGLGADLHLINGVFETGLNNNSLGILMRLDSRPLESVSIETPILATLATYSPPWRLEDWKKERKVLSEGVSRGGMFYRSRIPADVDANYAMRSVVFGSSDVLVVFRVLSQNWDESINIIWKRFYASGNRF
jgi:hypothetical protein